MSDKYRVTMTNVVLNADGTTSTLQATDYVPSDILDAYVTDAKARWQQVEVSADPDAGPGGIDGPTTVPSNLA